ncbi:hypothetical protein AX17_004116, partial [Amanita inopinata Kibby_2008]
MPKRELHQVESVIRTIPNWSPNEPLRYALKDDLKAILSSNFDFSGHYAYSAVLPQTPSPCLSITGIGSIQLPLDKWCAKKIIEHSSQAPYGHGNLTLVNKEVRDTWEIEPGCVKFKNLNWEVFVQDLATKTVCPSLGIDCKDNPPRCEFYKLLLYETGSRFLPHQ